MGIELDFRVLSEAQLAKQLVASVADLDDDHMAATLTAKLIAEEIASGRAVIVAERDAIAVVRPEGYRSDVPNSVLWLLFVKPSHRGKELGKAFVDDLRRRFERTAPMILACNGPRRESFFLACGFCVKERLDGGLVVMLSEPRCKKSESPGKKLV